MNFSKDLRVKPGLQLRKWNPSETLGQDRPTAEKAVERNRQELFRQQTLLYAENRQSLLIVLQGMDTSGKDGVIRQVITGLNPAGCTVTAFKAPSEEERDHDFLWRIRRATPRRGTVGIFNRSHYEDVLIVRVQDLVPKSEWKTRYDQINGFEKTLSHNGIRVVKFFLHISKEEQKERLEKRLKDPLKNWKFSEGDLVQRKRWDDYMEAYEAALNRCSTKWAPWYIIPADRKWFRNLAISEILRETLDEMKPKLPKPITNLDKIRIV